MQGISASRMLHSRWSASYRRSARIIYTGYARIICFEVSRILAGSSRLHCQAINTSCEVSGVITPANVTDASWPRSMTVS
jgi:hypothetical protein